MSSAEMYPAHEVGDFVGVRNTRRRRPTGGLEMFRGSFGMDLAGGMQ